MITLPKHLYHFSEDPSIRRSIPHVAPTSSSDEALVWSIDAEHSHLYYFPRDCPRVLFARSSHESSDDVERFFAYSTATTIAAIESRWLERLRNTTVYKYTLPSDGFELRDQPAGYWGNEEEVRPLRVEPIPDLMHALADAGVELRITPSLWPLRDAVIASSLVFSIIRWRNAAPR